MLQPEELRFFCGRCGDECDEIGGDLCCACMSFIVKSHDTMSQAAKKARDAGNSEAAEGYLHLAYIVRQMHFDKNHFAKEIFLSEKTTPFKPAASGNGSWWDDVIGNPGFDL